MDPKINKWQRWIKIIKEDIRRLPTYRYVYQETNTIITNNSKINKQNTYHELFHYGYVAIVAMGIRRQIKKKKKDDNNISLVGLLDEICENYTILSREKYKDLFREDKVYENDFQLLLIDKTFDKFAGDGEKFINTDWIKSDIEKLKEYSTKIEDFVDKRLAHYDKKEPEIVTYDELDNAISFLDKLIVKYYLLLHCSSFTDTLRAEFQYDWKAIFKTPWIEE